MKKCFTSLLIIALAFSVSAQDKKAEPKKEAAPTHDHSHDGHDHSGHDHAHPAAAPAPVGAGQQEEKQTPPNPNAAKIIFKEETHDFTEIPEGPQATHEFKFTNTGKEPLILSNVRASCGCTTPSWPKEPILPGKEGVIVVTYNTQGRPGPFTKSVTINSNSDTPDKVIFIKGDVVKEDPTKSVPVEQPNMMLAPKN